LALYRGEQICARRHGLDLPRQTLARCVELAADWLRPTYEAIRAGFMAGGYVQIERFDFVQYWRELLTWLLILSC
jgi:hypothetical protein